MHLRRANGAFDDWQLQLSDAEGGGEPIQKTRHTFCAGLSHCRHYLPPSGAATTPNSRPAIWQAVAGGVADGDFETRATVE